MSSVSRKTEVGELNGTPVKRMFWSIISDYGLKTGICELVDNALDLWKSKRQRGALKVEIILDATRQLIKLVDNAGGVPGDELELLIVPGGSRNDPNAHVIGIFGVGSKRAGIALGENVRIQTRHKRDDTFEIEIDKAWLSSTDWTLGKYAIPNIAPNTTIVEITHLRTPLTEADVARMRLHLGETYEWFINQSCIIELNGETVQPICFDTWAYTLSARGLTNGIAVVKSMIEKH